MGLSLSPFGKQRMTGALYVETMHCSQPYAGAAESSDCYALQACSVCMAASIRIGSYVSGADACTSSRLVHAQSGETSLFAACQSLCLLIPNQTQLAGRYQHRISTTCMTVRCMTWTSSDACGSPTTISRTLSPEIFVMQHAGACACSHQAKARG